MKLPATLYRKLYKRNDWQKKNARRGEERALGSEQTSSATRFVSTLKI
jgi:hypothetical protein